MEFQRGRQGGWMVIGIPPDDEGLEEEPFALGGMVLEMISETEQAKPCSCLAWLILSFLLTLFN